MKNIAFLWYWSRAKWAFPRWRDGLRAAIDEIAKTNEVDIILGEYLPNQQYDYYLLWGDSNCIGINDVDILRNTFREKGKFGIILTTDPINIQNLKKLDVVFCESRPVYEAVRQHGIKAVHAFGTDVDFFSPDPSIQKDIEYFYPATFSPWK